MTVLYRGAGVGTYWHQHDARLTGFVPQNPGMARTNDQLKKHIARLTTASPFISLTRSWDVAWDYAVYFGHSKPDQGNPAYVYEIEITPSPNGPQLLDPVKVVAKEVPGPFSSATYQHNGQMSLLLGIIDHQKNAPFLQAKRLQAGSQHLTPNITLELETLVLALRDAEILAVGSIPSNCVLQRESVW